jgi:chorismate mutase
MAGDWLKMTHALPEKPEVLAIAGKTGANRLEVVGRLFVLWRWFDNHTTDGNALGVTSLTLEECLFGAGGNAGFVAAVVSVGWLIESECGIRVVKFDSHTSESAKERAQTAKRVAKSKSKGKGNADANAQTVTQTVTETVPREEKRREEISPSLRSGDDAPKRAAPFDPSSVELPECVSAEDWARWCADRSKRRKPVTPEAAKLQLAKLVAFMADGHLPKDVIDNSIANGYQGLFAPKAAPRSNGGHTGFAKKDYRKGVNEDGFFN